MKNRTVLGPCPVCGRPMIDGPSVDRHHWTPRAAGGRESEYLHRICHRMLHRVFTEKELTEGYADPATVREHPDIRRFIAWVRRRPPDYVDWPRKAGNRRGKSNR